MRTDFKEERKWKIANAHMLSKAIMEWHNTKDKSIVCIKTREPMFLDIGQDKAIKDELIKIPTSDVDMSAGETRSVLKSDVEMTEPAVIKTDPTTNDLIADDEEDDEEEEEEDTPHISNQVKTEYHQLIQSCDPNQTVFTLIDENHDLISLFPDLLLYTAPDPNCIGNDPYFDEAEYSRILPFKVSTQRIVLHHHHQHPQKQSPPLPRLFRKRKYMQNDTLIQQPEEHVEDRTEGEGHLSQVSRKLFRVSHASSMYTNCCNHLLALFAPKKLKDAPAIQPPTPQAPQRGSRNIGTWTEEDDLCLIQCIVQYSFNWDLICDAFNATRSFINGEKRTPWDCHERWRQNNLTSLSGQINTGNILCAFDIINPKLIHFQPMSLN